jgi:hypothetical protein
MHPELAHLVRARVACCNGGDWTAVRALTDPGYAYCEAGTGGRIDDLDDVLVELERLREVAPDAHVEVERVLVHEGVAVAELVWSATLLERRVRVADRAWFHWEDGAVVAEWHEVGVLGKFAPLVAAEQAERGGVPTARTVPRATGTLRCAPARPAREPAIGGSDGGSGTCRPDRNRPRSRGRRHRPGSRP